MAQIGGRVGGGVLPIKQVLPAHIASVKLNARASSKMETAWKRK